MDGSSTPEGGYSEVPPEVLEAALLDEALENAGAKKKAAQKAYRQANASPSSTGLWQRHIMSAAVTVLYED